MHHPLVGRPFLVSNPQRILRVVDTEFRRPRKDEWYYSSTTDSIHQASARLSSKFWVVDTKEQKFNRRNKRERETEQAA